MAQQEMMQDRIVQNNYSGLLQSAPVYGRVQRIVAQMIERDVAPRRAQPSTLPWRRNSASNAAE